MRRAGPTGSESGAALVTTLLIGVLLAGIAAALVTVTTTETLISGAHRHAHEASYAADAALERALLDLDLLQNWTLALLAPPANVQSTFVDGQPHPVAPDGRKLDVALLTKARQAESDAIYGPAVFGADSPRWRLFGQAPLAHLLPAGTPAQPAYVLVWIADDGADGDGDAAADSNGRVLLYAEAYGSGGARRSIEAAAGRSNDGILRVLAWRSVH